MADPREANALRRCPSIAHRRKGPALISHAWLAARHTAVRKWFVPVGLLVIVAAQVFLFSRLLETGMNFDEGFYMASLDALRHGQALGTQVFAPPAAWLLRVSPSCRCSRRARRRTGSRGRRGARGLGGSGRFCACALPRRRLSCADCPGAHCDRASVPVDAARVWADLPSLSVALVAAGLAALAGRAEGARDPARSTRRGRADRRRERKALRGADRADGCRPLARRRPPPKSARCGCRGCGRRRDCSACRAQAGPRPTLAERFRVPQQGTRSAAGPRPQL